MIITIDGPAGSGKSTTARGLANELGGQYLDTGAMYRAICLGVIRKYPGSTDNLHAQEVSSDSEIEMGHRVDGSQWIKLDGEDVSEQIRQPIVNENVSWVSAVPKVREDMVKLQRAVGEGFKGSTTTLVAEGRDMGTVVFVDAELKIYLVADVQVRATRRGQDLEAQGLSVLQSEVAETLHLRDELDSTRKESPLVRADDAKLVDTSDLTAEQVISRIAEMAREC